MIYTIISIIVLTIEISLLCLFTHIAIINKVVITRKTIWFFLPTFFIIFSLYFIGYLYQYKAITLLETISLLSTTIKTFTFDIKMEYIKPLFNDDVFFALSFIIAYLMAVYTIINAAISLFGNRIKNFARIRRGIKRGYDILIGYNPSVMDYIKNNPQSIIWVDSIDFQELSKLYAKGIPVITRAYVFASIARYPFNKNKEYHFIVFESEENSLIEFVKQYDRFKINNSLGLFLHLEVKYNQTEIVKDKILSQLNDNSRSFVTCFCRHELIARKFIMENPFTKFIPSNYFNSNGTVREDKNINVIFLGFGKINLELFNMFVINNQFVGEKDGRLHAKLVNYYAYDRDFTKLNNSLFLKMLEGPNHNLTLPEPEKLCNLVSDTVDIKSLAFISNLDKTINSNSYNFIVVSFACDFDNIEYSSYLYNRYNENKNLKIFCRVKNNKFKNHIYKEYGIIYFGCEEDILNHEVIADEKLSKLGRDINETYNTVSLTKLEKIRNWERLPLIRQLSNIYAAMNIPFKLHLMGLDLTKDNSKSISEIEYFQRYLEGSSEDIVDDQGKIHYNNYDEYFKTSLRNVLAYSEHLRWTAFYIINNFKQMSTKKIYFNQEQKQYVLKDEKKKEHACITTYYALDDLYKYVLNKSIEDNLNMSLQEIESYKYDYMVCDDLYKKLKSVGYYINKKE